MNTYDSTFTVTPSYRDSLPDVQNAPSTEIDGAHVPILQVGISNFRMPLRFLTVNSDPLLLEASITGTVSLKADAKGINMSRLMRIFYEFKDRIFTLDLLEEVLLRYKEELGSSRARLKVQFSYPILQRSLRSDAEGYQYYEVSYEGLLDDLNRFRKILHFDFVYSSACPCSLKLAKHATETRDIDAIPHSQRSKARISIEVRPRAYCPIEVLQKHCSEALKTETQVLARREDEQAFAELNGAFVKFVEDAARLLYEQLDTDPRIRDFQIVCVHLESLHSHDAIAVLTKGLRGGFTGKVDDFKTLIC